MQARHLYAMLDDDYGSTDNALVASALELPMSRYLEWAERPDVAHALSMFKSEREIRKTGRLDLVTWVQYICAFGYTGPSNEAWALLFSTCRVLPILEPSASQLGEHEIAVLLAYAKIKPDHCDSMTPAQLVKHRIKPAVLGRSDARTPGILHHIHAKFESWVFGPYMDMFCNQCVSIVDSGVLLPPVDNLPSSLMDVGDFIRKSAHFHANSLMKNWRGIITSVLGIDEGDCSSPRARRFEMIVSEKRLFMFQTLFIKMSEHYFTITQTSARLENDCTPTISASAMFKPEVATPTTPKTHMRSAVKRLLSATNAPPEVSMSSRRREKNECKMDEKVVEICDDEDAEVSTPGSIDLAFALDEDALSGSQYGDNDGFLDQDGDVEALVWCNAGLEIVEDVKPAKLRRLAKEQADVANVSGCAQ